MNVLFQSKVENKLNILWSDYYTLRIVRSEMKPVGLVISAFSKPQSLIRVFYIELHIYISLYSELYDRPPYAYFL